jgi:HK97 family phage major capsid protein
MTPKLKKLHEDVGALKKEIRSYLDSDARKAVSDKAADPKLKDLEARFASAADDLDAEFRQAARESGKPIDLSTSEQRDLGRFDYKVLLNHMHRSIRGVSGAGLDGIEAEMVQEGEREARECGLQPNGIVLPRLLVRRCGYERRDVSATGQTSVAGDQGGMTIATNKAGLLDDFYNASVLRAAGATVLEGLVGNLDIPRIVADTTKPLKKTENESAGEYTPTFAMLSLSPNRLPAFVDVGEQLLKQSSSAIEAILRSTLTNEMAAVQEKAFFHGGGTSEANGIAGTSGIGSVVGNTDGAAPTWAHIVGLETAVDTNNAILGNLHYFSNGQIRGKLKQTPVVASTDSRMIMDNNTGLINGYSPFFTNAISRTLTKGNQSLSSAIFFGNAADYWIGYWGGITLEMIRDSASAKVGQYCLVASTYYDGGVVRPKSFAAMLDALGA